MEQKLELRKSRDFGQLINDTFLFVRENLKPLLKVYFSICGFLLVAMTVVAVLQQNRLAGILTEESLRRDPFQFYGWEMVLSWVLVFIFYVLLCITTFSYMGLYKDKGNEAPTPQEVWEQVRYYFWRVSGAQLVLGLLVGIGMMFCVLPGLYLWPVVTLMLAIMVIENGSLTYSFDRGFRLISGHWWATFGAMFILSVVSYAVMMLFVMPFGIATGAGLLLGNLKLSLPMLIAATVVQYLSQILLVIVLITAGLAYFSLVEEKEGTSLSDRINSIGKGDDAADLPEEQY